MLTFEPVAHRYFYDGKPVPNVTSVLESAGFYSFGGASPDALRFARERGQAIHTATELDDRDDLDEDALDPQIAPYLAAWRRFRLQCEFVPTAIEERVYHPRLHYAGTLDRRGTMILGGRRGPVRRKVLLDIKHGVPQRATGPQTAAYLHTLPPVERRAHSRFAVYLQADSRYNLIPHDDAGDFAVFAAALILHNWKAAHA